MNSRFVFGLGAAILFQIVVLIGMVINSALPLVTGHEVKLKTVPYDPRSLFRGNYARLNYEISRIDGEYFSDVETLRSGEVVYVSLAPGADGLQHLTSVSLEKPNTGTFLRGTVDGQYFSVDQPVLINYGIEAYFAPKEEALRLERELREEGVSVLMVTDSGRARLKSVEALH